MPSVVLTSKLVEAFAGVFLSPRYDSPKPVAQFHREAWDAYVSPDTRVDVAAPRDHGKSTALTFIFILAEVCFRASDYVILIGSTEDKASEQLSNISEELADNEDLRREFGITRFETEQKTEIIVICEDGHRFRIIARGAEQKIRGAMWKGKRPNLIVCDDMEDDEQVENRDRRAKFRRWFFRAVMQAKSKTGRVRVHGTILHEDSLLARLHKNKMWRSLLFRAHQSYSDFSNILWPERWSAKDLRDRQREFEEDQDPSGYAQEFLNNPLDHSDAYLKKDWLLPMLTEDYDTKKRTSIGADFAVSKKDKANRTSFTVGGEDMDNILHIIDEKVGRWDTSEWVDVIFDLQNEYNPEFFFVEDGVIWKSIYPTIRNEMRSRNIWINFFPILPVKDKATRGRSFQRRVKAGGMRFDKESEWYAGYEDELLRFTGHSDAILDDQFDSTAILVRGIEELPSIEDDEDVMTPDEREEEFSYRRQSNDARGSRRGVTGY